jgi:salicylate hydroxylase
MSTRKRSPKVLIAGAGLGGLTAALALLRNGFDVQVFEQAPALGEVGAGIQLSANANQVLFKLGLEDALMKVASFTSGKRIRLWNTGQTWKLFDLGAESIKTYGYPYLTVYRPDLHQVLVDAVRKQSPEAIQLGCKCVDVRQTADSVVLELGDGRSIAGDILIGADGVHSHIRRALFGGDEPSFSGLLAWRGVIPAAVLPAHLREPLGVNWVGPGGHVIHYPLRRGELVNFVGCVERVDWQVESWTQQGTVEECLNDYPGWNEDVHTLIRNIGTPFKWALMVREPMAKWVVERVALLGDACHPTLPMLASGAAMAIEDGYILARSLVEHGGDFTTALPGYEAARVERTAKVVRGSAENAKRFHNPQLAHAEGAAAYVDREWSEERVRQRYDWLFSYNADAAPV